MARMWNIVQGCSKKGCFRQATVRVAAADDTCIGDFCREHGKKALRKQNAAEGVPRNQQRRNRPAAVDVTPSFAMTKSGAGSMGHRLHNPRIR